MGTDIELWSRFREYQWVVGSLFVVQMSALVSLLFCLWGQYRRGGLHFDSVLSLDVSPAQLLPLFMAILLMMVSGIGYAFALVLILGVLGVLYVCRVDWRVQFGSRRLPFWVVALGSLWIGLAVFPPLQALSFLGEKSCQWLGWHVKPQPAVDLFMRTTQRLPMVTLLGYALIGAPLAEEILFRGCLYPVLKNRLGKDVAIFIASAAFAALHSHTSTFVALFVFGCILTLIFEATGSLPLCMGVHAFFNATTAAMLCLLKYGNCR